MRDGKAHIIKEFCIDCGECIRICPHHAKKATYDSFESLWEFDYTIALPPPSLFGQFNNLDDPDTVLQALLRLGFDEVYEVGMAAEMVSEMTRRLMREGKLPYPVISSACPSVMRLIRVRFPNLIDRLLPLNAPVELAAGLARKDASARTGIPPERIGVTFITPCPAKVTAIRVPLGNTKSHIDRVTSIKEMYPRLLPLMTREDTSAEHLSQTGKIGVSWGGTGGEAAGILNDNYLAADGIENVIRVLEDLEDQKFSNLEFIELNACQAGCVGGVLTVENPHIALAKLKRLRRYMPVARNHLDGQTPAYAEWDGNVKYLPVFSLGTDFEESITLMAKAEEICERLPGLDCGSCGAPTCSALAQDVVRGNAREEDCIHILREHIHRLSSEISLLDSRRSEKTVPDLQEAGHTKEDPS